MAIRKRGNSWQIDVLIPTGKLNEEGKDIKERYRRTFDKKKEAAAEHDKLKTLCREKRFLDVKVEYKTTLGQLVEKYTEVFKDQPYYNAKQHWLKNFLEYFGQDRLLASIQYFDVQTYQTYLKRKKTRYALERADSTTNREISCLRHLLSTAVEWKLLGKSPFRDGKRLSFQENNQRIRYLENDELARLLEECKRTPHLYRVVVCALNTGMRKGEILSLKWDQIRNGFIYLDKTKTKTKREIPINDTLDALFHEIMKQQGRGERYVFGYGRRDRLWFTETSWKAALARAGIEDFHFHDLRHCFASYLLMRGATLKDVQELLGHKGANMTLRYAHVLQEHKKAAVNLLNDLPGNPPPDSMSQNVTNPIRQNVSPLH